MATKEYQTDRKAIAIISGDWHIHTWKSFNEGDRRLKAHIDAVLNLGYLAKEYWGCPIIFTGDFGHNFGKASLKLLDAIKQLKHTWILNDLPPIIGISGNHDQEAANYSEDQKSRDLWSYVSDRNAGWFNINWGNYGFGHCRVWGIPYLTYNKTFKDYLELVKKALCPDTYNILVIHTDLHGAMDGDREVGSVEGIPQNMDEFFEGFDLVVSGHIHQHQKLGKKIYMVGALQQQRRSDIGKEFGYYILWDYRGKLKMEFKPLNDQPEFRILDPGQLPPDTFHYYISSEQSPEEVEDDLGFSNSVSKTKLVKNYMKAIGEPSVSKRLLLTKLLNSVIDD